MIRNYLKLTWRNLSKNKAFSFINIAGLAIGMAACILILEYVSFELSYDQFNSKTSDIYRVYNDRYQNGKLVQHGTITYSAVSPDMQTDFPEVVNHLRMVPNGGQILINGDQRIEVLDAMNVEPSFFQMFDYPMLVQEKPVLLNSPNEVVLSESVARKIFQYRGGDLRSLLGRLVTISRDSLPYKVTAIMADIPENSHLHFEMLMPYMSLNDIYHWGESVHDYTDSDFWHYIQLRHGTDYKAFEKKLAAFSDRHLQGNKVSGSVEKFYLQPLAKAHLYSDFEYEIGKTASATVVWGLLVIALFIIGIAWVNYINLSTARSVERAREVGIRKVTGATRGQLIRQFLAEAVVLNVIALGIALLGVLLLQSGFNHLVDFDLSFSYLFHKGLDGYAITIGLIALIVVGILASGFYPSFVLSSFKPILVLKGKFSSSRRGTFLRKGLVIGQFAITVVLIAGSLVVYQQMRYVSHQKLGMNLDQMLVLKGPGLTSFDSTFFLTAEAFKNELKSIPHVKGVAITDRDLGQDMARAFNVRREGDDPGNKHTIRNYGASYEFLKTYDIPLAAGRDFLPTDYHFTYQLIHNVLMNESAVHLFGFASDEDAVGKRLLFYGRTYDIVGVIKDFHQKSLHYAIEPMLLIPRMSTGNPISVKVDPNGLPATIAAIRTKYQAFFPGNVFSYYFMDEKFNQDYQDDNLFGKVFGIFAGFAIFVACLGLLGLALFATAQRIKEIGVRKVLGASVGSIVLLLSRDFIRLVFLAILAAIPIAWYVMHHWLQNFTYRIDISAWVFVASGLLAVVIALVTISFQTIRAAVANPVKSLRTE